MMRRILSATGERKTRVRSFQHLYNNDVHGVGGLSSDTLQEEAGPSDQEHTHRFWTRERLHQSLVEFLQ